MKKFIALSLISSSLLLGSNSAKADINYVTNYNSEISTYELFKSTSFGSSQRMFRRAADVAAQMVADVRVSVLAELYFIHVHVPDVVDWSTRGGEAVGRAILSWLKANP